MNYDRATSEAVCVVIVTYNPDVTRLGEILRAAAAAVDWAVVVDNGSAEFDEQSVIAALPTVILRRFPDNFGIGVAQNDGIVVARSLGARFVLFLDQDSVPQQGMVARLLVALGQEVARGEAVACVGPQVRLPGVGRLSAFTTLGWIRSHRVSCRKDGSLVPCDLLISSGMLIPMSVLDELGGMDERLFIDQIDTEWCLRARAKGYKIFGVCGAALEHRLGESHRRLWFGRWRRLPRHKAFRYYYIFRNTILLTRREYISLKYTVVHAKWLLALFLVYGLFTRERNGELRMMVKGLRDGLRGVTGKLASA